MNNLTSSINVKQFNSIAELEQSRQEIAKRAQSAAKRAYAPYSKFNVGACVLLNNGQMIEGSNQENASYPCGICAERTAMFYANSTYPEAVPVAIAIAAFNNGKLLDEPITPCGMCRQVLLETETRYNSKLEVIMVGANHTYSVNSASDLLSLSFTKDVL
ncbi:MAG: cytidine deaminase [Salinivirgaceae bacterium]|nr:cytidine deaminase [Salinivirgaceae bacterium]